MSMFSQNEILLMIGVVSVLLLIITILTVFDIIDYLKNRKKVKLDEELEIKVEEEVPKKMEKVEVLEVNDNDENLQLDTNNIDNEVISPIVEQNDSTVLIEEMPVDEKECAVEPIIKDEENIELAPVRKIENNKINIEEEFNKALNVPNGYDAIQKFEEEQEKTAIISLDELIKKSDELYNSNEVIQYDDGNEPITIDEVINRYKEENASVPEIMQDIVLEKPVYTHKENIPFISSVYGIEKSDDSLEFENTATYEKLSRSKDSDFISRLREINENK